MYYYFGESYTFNEETKQFSLSGNTISGTWGQVHDEAIANYPYTCFGTSATSTCTTLKNVIRYTNNYTSVLTCYLTVLKIMHQR